MATDLAPAPTTVADLRIVAFYGRVSAAKDDQQVSTDQQRTEMLPLAEDIAGGAEVEQYVDESISAWSGARRPEFERLVAHLTAGRVGYVVSWHLNRLARQPLDWHRFEAVAIKHNVLVHTKGGEYDLRIPHVRQMAGMEALLARSESDGKSEAVVRGMKHAAEIGRWHGRLAYGYRRTWAPNAKGRPMSVAEVIEPAEEAVIVEIADRILRGDSLRAIARDLNQRGLPSPGPTTSRRIRDADDDARQWTSVKVKSVVSRQRNIGKRVYQAKGQQQVISDAQWPSILAEGKWLQVRAILEDPTRRTSTSSRTAHLLSGLARCGVCGSVVKAATNRNTPSYKCSSKSCVSRNRADVDALVDDLIIGRLSMPDAVDELRPKVEVDDSSTQKLAELKARKALAANEFANGNWDAQQVTQVNATLDPQITALEARRTQTSGKPAATSMAGPDADQAWGAASLDIRRTIIAELISIRILPARRGARTFDPSAVSITWR